MVVLKCCLQVFWNETIPLSLTKTLASLGNKLFFTHIKPTEFHEKTKVYSKTMF